MHFTTIIHYSRSSSHLFQMFLWLFRHAVKVNKLFKNFTITFFFFLTGNKIQEISRPKHFSPTLYRLTALKYKFAKYLVLIVGPLTNKKFQRFVLFCHWNCCTRFQQIHGKLRYWVAMRFPLSTVCGWCFCTFQITWSIETISKLFRFLSC